MPRTSARADQFSLKVAWKSRCVRNCCRLNWLLAFWPLRVDTSGEMQTGVGGTPPQRAVGTPLNRLPRWLNGFSSPVMRIAVSMREKPLNEKPTPLNQPPPSISGDGASPEPLLLLLLTPTLSAALGISSTAPPTPALSAADGISSTACDHAGTLAASSARPAALAIQR